MGAGGFGEANMQGSVGERSPFRAPPARPPERSGAQGSPRATALGGSAGRSPPIKGDVEG